MVKGSVATGNRFPPFRWVSLIILAAALGFWPALRAGFIYDDRFFVVENASIRSLSLLPDYFTSPQTTTASIPWNPIWRPLRNVSFAIDYLLWGLRPEGYHLANLMFHAANGLLLLFIACRLWPVGPAPLLAALVFMLHPVQSEAVVWVSGRDNLLALFFLLGTWLARLRYRQSQRRTWWCLSLLSFILALLSKETAAAFVFALPLLDYISTARERGAQHRLWLEYLVWTAVVAAYVLLRFWLLGKMAHRGYWGGAGLSNGLTMLWVLAQYIRLTVLPLWLRVDYVVAPVTSLRDGRWIVGAALLIGLSTAVWRYGAKGWPLLAWGWFLIMLLPVANLIPIAAVMAERFLYIPMVGAALAGGRLLAQFPRRTMWIASGLILSLMLGLSVKRSWEWQDPGRFWRIETIRSPQSAIAWNNLGHHYYRRGEMVEAEQCFRQAVSLNPLLAAARASLGDVYYHTQRYRLALEQYQEYLRLEPEAHNREQAIRRIQRIETLLSPPEE